MGFLPVYSTTSLTFAANLIGRDSDANVSCRTSVVFGVFQAGEFKREASAERDSRTKSGAPSFRA